MCMCLCARARVCRQKAERKQHSFQRFELFGGDVQGSGALESSGVDLASTKEVQVLNESMAALESQNDSLRSELAALKVAP